MPESQDRQFFAAAAIPLLELDLSGIPQGLPLDQPPAVDAALAAARILAANTQAAALLGFTDVSDICGPFSRLWPAASRPVFRQFLTAAQAQRSSFTADTRLQRIAGSEVAVSFVAWALPGERMSNKCIVALIDISPRVAAEQTVERLQADLAHAGRISMMGELAASIAHEVNQPLAAIVTNAQAGLRWLRRAQPDLEEIDALLQRIIEGGQRGSALIQRMQAMSRKQAPALAEGSVNEIITEAMLLLRHEFARHETMLTLELLHDLPAVLLDRTQLQQVVVNLSLNAAQAMTNARSSRRTLTICTSKPAEAMIAVEFQDSGPGIEPEDRQRIFDSFYTTKAEGTGVGLSICRSIIAAHGGVLDVRSTSPSGTTIRFTLPSIKPPEV